MARKSRIYTRSGDHGTTSLIGGTRVPKYHIRLRAYGCADEANSQIGFARACLQNGENSESVEDLDMALVRIQHLLFNLGSILACESDPPPEYLPRIEPKHVEWLESLIDEYDAKMPRLQNFILPGGNTAGSAMHVARATCRRAERLCSELQETEPMPEVCLIFLNRLSDLLFVMARWINHHTDGAGEVVWEKQ